MAICNCKFIACVRSLPGSSRNTFIRSGNASSPATTYRAIWFDCGRQMGGMGV